MLKNSQSHALSCIIKLFNLIFVSGIYPAKQKIGYIKPRYKDYDPNLSDDYRGTTVMPCLAKLFNSVLNNRLQIFLNKYNTINHCLFCFHLKPGL